MERATPVALKIPERHCDDGLPIRLYARADLPVVEVFAEAPMTFMGEFLSGRL